jgi:hypothetical protein
MATRPISAMSRAIRSSIILVVCILSLQPYAAIGDATNVPLRVENNLPDAIPLRMDVEWVMQGWNFGFQGFYVEFLGYLEGLRKYLPYARIVQSSFRKSMQDPAVINSTHFYEVD